MCACVGGGGEEAGRIQRVFESVHHNVAILLAVSRKNWIRIPALVYASHAVTQVCPWTCHLCFLPLSVSMSVFVSVSVSLSVSASASAFVSVSLFVSLSLWINFDIIGLFFNDFACF